MSSARDAARVLVIDETDQILLIRGQDPSRPEIGSWWYAPGGGLEPGESHSEAAARELWEETGLRAVIDTDPIWQREVNFTFNGVEYLQREIYFLLRTKSFQPIPQVLSELEKVSLLEPKWWSQDELLTLPDLIYPNAIRSEFEYLLSAGEKALKQVE